jgi:hypothetical protein
LAASALPVAASQRSTTAATTYNQWAAVGCKRFACGCKQEHHARQIDIEAPMSGCWLQVSKQHQRGNNLQLMSGCWLQARAPHEAERHWGTNERLLTIESKLLDKATGTMGPNSYGT